MYVQVTYTEDQVVEDEEDSENEDEAKVAVNDSDSGDEGTLCFAACTENVSCRTGSLWSSAGSAGVHLRIPLYPSFLARNQVEAPKQTDHTTTTADRLMCGVLTRSEIACD